MVKRFTRMVFRVIVELVETNSKTEDELLLSGVKLRETRKERHMTMRELCKKAGISRTYLWMLETTDHNKVPIDVFISLASALDTTVLDLSK